MSVLLTAWAWVQLHQMLSVAVVTGAASLAYPKIDSYPRGHAMLSLLAGFGVDLPVIRSAFVRLITGKWPPSSGPSADATAKVDVPSIPIGTSALRRDHFLPAMGFALFAMFVFCCIGLVGCSGAQTHSSIELGAYTADDAVCVTEASSKDAGDACLDEYKTKYAVFWADSGVTTCTVAAVDGGAK